MRGAAVYAVVVVITAGRLQVPFPPAWPVWSFVCTLAPPTVQRRARQVAWRLGVSQSVCRCECGLSYRLATRSGCVTPPPIAAQG